MTFPELVGNGSGMVGVAEMGPETAPGRPETPPHGPHDPVRAVGCPHGVARVGPKLDSWGQKSTLPKSTGGGPGMVGVAEMGPETAPGSLGTEF